MNRASEHRALVLSVRAIGESNREAVFLCSDIGIVRAVLYGGPKSKLRAHIAPYHSGRLWLYHDPVRDSWKVTDFDVLDWRPGLRENLERSLDAAVIIETLLLCHASGGAWAEALSLAEGSLDLIATAASASVRPMLLRFFWLWADLLGIRPDLSRCAVCGGALGEEAEMCYVERDGQLVCASCAALRGRQSDGSGRPNALHAQAINIGTRRWLEAVSKADAKTAVRINLTGLGLSQAELLSRTVVEAAVGQKLKSMAN